MMHILIVDDFYANVVMIQQALSSKYEVSTATSGKQALQAMYVNKPDLVVLDIQMPELSGLDVLRMMKEDDALKQIPVVFLTGTADRKNVILGYKLGIMDVIAKPIIIAKVESRIDRVFQKLEEEKNASSEEEEILDTILEDDFWMSDDWKDLI